MRLTSLLALVATTATTTTALYLPSWNNHNEELPSLSAQQWQEVKAMGYDQVTQGIKMADDFIGRIVDDVEHRTHKNLKGDDSQKTIWQLLNQDSDRYSKLLKAIEIEGGHAKDVLDDRESSITFFAPENSGIPNPPHHRDEDHSSLSASMDTLVKNPSLDTLLHVHSLHGQTLFGEHDHDDDKDKERKKRIFKFILGEILKYHGLPQAVTAGELANNKTIVTALIPKFGANDGEPLRLRVEKNLVPPSLELNFYAKVVATHSDRKAINGYLHEIDHPLLPPPSVLDSVFFSRDFDTFTTAIQKIGGAGAVAWEFSGKLSKEQHHPVFVGAPAITAFVPTTDAFKKLPKKLQFFLFSPFGEDVLRKILQFHIIPTHTVFTEAVHKVGTKHDHDHGGHKHGHHHEHEKKSWLEDEVEALMMLATDGDETIHLDETFPTLLENATLRVVIDKDKPLPIPGATKTTLTVNDVEAEVIDIPALNGVFHVLPEVLKPPHKHHDEEGELVESEWSNWEQWLVQWAAAN